MSSATTFDFVVSATPDKSLVFTNHVYIHKQHTLLLSNGHGKTNPFIRIGSFVFIVQGHDQVAPNSIALSSIQRQSLKVSVNDSVSIDTFQVPTDHSIDALNMCLEVDVISKRATITEEALAAFVRTCFVGQVFVKGQTFLVDYLGTSLNLSVKSLEVVIDDPAQNQEEEEEDSEGSITKDVSLSMLVQTSNIEIDAAPSKLLTFTKNPSNKRSQLFNPNFKFSNMGIGGLNAEFGQLFRRSFASRVFSPDLVAKLGVKHAKGILLYGPPGTGKTLIARQIGKLLAAREPKIVNGPEILNKFVGASEENIRKLFAEAEQDYKQNGENADLHIIIFDEIDAICKARGRGNDSTGVHDTIVNQLLTKIDGVDSLNNILVIGMTNRKDMIDPALLRPGRLEVHIEIGLPDEKGRAQIFDIHLKKMKENGCLAPDVSSAALAALTKNFSGAEIEGLIRSAASFTLNRFVDVSKGVPKAKETHSLRVGMRELEAALEEVHAAFGVDENELKTYLRNELVDYGPEFQDVMSTCQTLVEQIRNSKDTPLLSILLSGTQGSGKTSMAARIAIDSHFPFVKIISPEHFVGASETKKCQDIVKIFEDAYKSPLSLIILDNIERLLEFVPVGPRFNQSVLQTLLVLINRLPPHPSRKLLIVGTTSRASALENLEITQAFNVVKRDNALNKPSQIKRVLELSQFPVALSDSNLGELTAACPLPIPIKDLLMVLEMSKQGQEPLTVSVFQKCFKACGYEKAKFDVNK